MFANRIPGRTVTAVSQCRASLSSKGGEELHGDGFETPMCCVKLPKVNRTFAKTKVGDSTRWPPARGAVGKLVVCQCKCERSWVASMFDVSLNLLT